MPDKLFKCSFNENSWLRLPISGGIGPTKEFLCA